MLDPLASGNGGEDPRLVVLQFWWNDYRDWPAYHLLGRVTKEALRGRVPAGHDPVQVLAHDRVNGTLNNCGQFSGCVLHALTLDRERDRAGQDFHQLEVFRGWEPLLLGIHGKGCQHFAVRRENG